MSKQNGILSIFHNNFTGVRLYWDCRGGLVKGAALKAWSGSGGWRELSGGDSDLSGKKE